MTSIAVTMRRGALALDVQFPLTAPWTCLFGASGSGKTSILRAIAGLHRPDSGRIVIGDTVVFDATERVWVAPHRRPVRSAMQTAWLFPGTVGKNLRARANRKDHDESMGRILRMFRLDGLESRRVEALSGGERQRVSLARAVVAAVYGGSLPVRLLLLDEPFAGMDTALRDRLAVELRGFLEEKGVGVLSVTHDVGETFLLKAEVVRIVDGRVVAHGPVEEVLARERTAMLLTLGGG